MGSVYINASDSTNPATLFGFGTWVTVGDGKVLVNQDTGDTSFDTLGETGGSKDAVVVSHSHTATDAGHTHSITPIAAGQDGAGYVTAGAGTTGESVPQVTTGYASITVSTTGSSGTNANLQPYVVVKMWKRTA